MIILNTSDGEELVSEQVPARGSLYLHSYDRELKHIQAAKTLLPIVRVLICNLSINYWVELFPLLLLLLMRLEY